MTDTCSTGVALLTPPPPRQADHGSSRQSPQGTSAHTWIFSHVLDGVVGMLGHVGQGVCWSAWLLEFPAVLVFVECCGCFVMPKHNSLP